MLAPTRVAVSTEPRISLASDLCSLTAQCQVEIGVHRALAIIENSIENINKEQSAMSTKCVQESNKTYVMPSELSGFPAKSLTRMDFSKFGVELSVKSCGLTTNALKIS